MASLIINKIVYNEFYKMYKCIIRYECPLLAICIVINFIYFDDINKNDGAN